MSLLISKIDIFTALASGIVFGFLLHKAKVTKFSTIVGQLLLKDFTVMKVILTAIAFGSLGLYSLKHLLNDTHFIISTTTLLASLIGGGIFGIGMAVLGFCPGTCVGALVDDTRYAASGLLGMFFGIFIYSQAFPWIYVNLKPAKDISKITIPAYFNISPWFLILPLCVIVISWLVMDSHLKRNKFSAES